MENKREVQKELAEHLMKVIGRECDKENATPEELKALAEVANVVVMLLNF